MRGGGRRRVLTGGVALVATATVAACSSTSAQVSTVAAAGRSTPSAAVPSADTAPATPSVPPTPAPTGPVSPLTGVPGPDGRTVAVKIDNSPSAWRLQRGLESAGVIYQELVEGGETRLMAVVTAPEATVLEPVRSGRESDVDILGQYGKVVLGYSGANTRVQGVLGRAGAVRPVSCGTDGPPAPSPLTGRGTG